MTNRGRVRKALGHEQPDAIPVDFGSTAVTGMHCSCVAALRNHYGLEKQLVKAFEPYQMLGWIDDDLKQAMGIDTVGICPRNTIFGFPNENWKEFRMPWGQEVLVSEHFNTTKDTSGDLLIYPQGDTSVGPSGRMPEGGYFFDTIIRQPEIDESNLNPDDNLEEFVPVSADDLRYFADQARQAGQSGNAVVATFGGTGFGDIALVPGPFLKHPKGIRDVAEWYVSTVTRQDLLHEIFSRQCDIALRNLAEIRPVVGDAVDVVFLCGTDFGTQTSSFCSTETFDSLYAPYYLKVNDWIHENTGWKTLKHSCGAVEPFLPHLIKAGFDIINPVQCSAVGMSPPLLKDRHGDKLIFWGGGVDTQKTLPFGTTEDVRVEVLERCRIFSRSGGFIFNSIHNVQPGTPIENIIAMLDAVREFGGG